MVERLHLGCWRLRPSRWRILRQSKLILCRLSVNGIIKVHTRLVPQHNVPVNEETHLSCLKYNKDQICVMTWIHVSKVRLPGLQLREWQWHRQLPSLKKVKYVLILRLLLVKFKKSIGIGYFIDRWFSDYRSIAIFKCIDR
jgi:hypothetical protein